MVLIYRSSFDVSSVENLHDAVYAFFRTSEFGVWQREDAMPVDPFALTFCRGQEVRLPSKIQYHLTVGSRSYANYVGQSFRSKPITPSMRLNVGIRPLSGGARITLEYHLTGPQADLLREAFALRLRANALEEVKGLAAYLQESCGLPGLPEIDPD